MRGLAFARAADSQIATHAVNALGVDLYHAHSAGEENLLISPYSIQSALAMLYAGAGGDTRAEMQSALHFPADEKTLHESFQALATEMAARSVEAVAKTDPTWGGGPKVPIELTLSNRLFGSRAFGFHDSFLRLLKENYNAPLQPMDFTTNPEAARTEINRWISSQTSDRIRDLLAQGCITPKTSLWLVNALSLRAPWATAFKEKATRNAPFFAHSRDKVDVLTMNAFLTCGFADPKGFTVIGLPYAGTELQFIILLPENPDGLGKVANGLSPEILNEFAHLPRRKIVLHLPKFRLEPPALSLSAELKALGMKRAFDGSADFTRMAAPRPDGNLVLGEVSHQSFLTLDEKGTEAAAATTAKYISAGMATTPRDRPKSASITRSSSPSSTYRAVRVCFSAASRTRVDRPRRVREVEAAFAPLHLGRLAKPRLCRLSFHTQAFARLLPLPHFRVVTHARFGQGSRV